MPDIDNVIDDVDDEVEKKKTGPQKKREVFFYGLPKDTKFIKVRQEGEKLSRADAVAQITEKLGEGAIILGAMYDVKGGKKTENDGTCITVKARDVVYSSNRYEGVFGGWNVICNGLKSLTVNGEVFEDNDLVSVTFEDRVEVNSKSAKPRIAKNGMVRISEIESISAL